MRHLAEVDMRVALVSCCDKLHNARSILSDHLEIGDDVFERFTASKQDTLWYYLSLSDKFTRHLSGRVAREFALTVDELHRVSGMPIDDSRLKGGQ